MKHTRPSRAAIVGLLILFGAASADAGEEPGDERPVRVTTAQAEASDRDEAPAVIPAATRESATATPLPVYKLPSVGKPRRRVGGGRRGGESAPRVTALVPDHVGLTAQAQPSLYWRLEGAAAPGARFEIALTDGEAIDPLVERALGGPLSPGLQRIDLAELGVSLAVGPEYEWSVALVVDPQERSRDLVTTGWIRRVAEPDPPAGDAATRAAQGLWYDALDAAARDPAGGPALAALLSQVGLDAAQ
jgi:hypothetical protein